MINASVKLVWHKDYVSSCVLSEKDRTGPQTEGYKQDLFHLFISFIYLSLKNVFKFQL